MAHRPEVKKPGLIFILILLGFLLSAFFHLVSADTILDSGIIVNTKMITLAKSTYPAQNGKSCEIKAIRITKFLPDDFIPSDDNTVSSIKSTHPVYILFDNTDDAGIIYFYTESDKIMMNSHSEFMFSDLTALTDISGLSDWDTSKVTSMFGLFSGAKSLSDISALKSWNTTNVSDMNSLFRGAKSLTNALALRDWDTSNVTDMSYMFSGAESLMFVDISNWKTGKVTNMTCMFQVGDSWQGNGQLKEINGLGDLDVSNVTNMTCMFYGAGKMTYYDVSRWNVSKVESMNHMFCDNFLLKSLDLSSWDVSSVKTMYCMFDDCGLLKTIGDVSHWNTSSLIDAGGWLNYATAFVGNNEGTLDLSGWDTSNLKAAGEMFLKTKIHKIDLSGWTFNSITNDRWEGAGRGIYYETGNDPDGLEGFGQMFKDTPNLTTVYVSQSGLDSFNAAMEREVNTLDMWTNSKTDGFTVK